MDSRQQQQHAGVKVTYIETRFVTSDAAGFKDLVQRLTGKSPTATGGAAAPHIRPRASRTSAGAGMTTTAAAGAAAGPQGYHNYYQPGAGEVMRYPAVVAGRAQQCQQDELLFGMDDDFSDLFYVGAIDQRRHGLNNGGYGDFVHY
jgi:hypothetical protein